MHTVCAADAPTQYTHLLCTASDNKLKNAYQSNNSTIDLLIVPDNNVLLMPYIYLLHIKLLFALNIKAKMAQLLNFELYKSSGLRFFF